MVEVSVFKSHPCSVIEDGASMSTLSVRLTLPFSVIDQLPRFSEISLLILNLDPGFITVKQGVPWRNGVWKHKVLDGTNKSKSAVLGYSGVISEVPMECAIHANMGTPLVGEKGDSFVVSLRMSLKPTMGGYLTNLVQSVRRTGYNELWSALWTIEKTDNCSHMPHYGDKANLEPGWKFISGYEDSSFEHTYRLIICLTACDPVARWRTLITIFEHRTSGSHRVLLRGAACCLRCSVDQALRRPGLGILCFKLLNIYSWVRIFDFRRNMCIDRHGSLTEDYAFAGANT
ncbi:hypothetical protein BGZ60DRAFT_528080 [Tricladium varicosporioides]|nr:hypothetical protein BGZ60DRAFT_528080 [Hymenoscyphus varicosporioides]